MIPGAPPSSSRWSQVRPWAGVIVGPLAWLGLQQGLGTLVYYACARGGPPWGPLLGLLAVLACGGSGWMSWRAAIGNERRVFIGRAAAGIAGLLSLGCALISLSALTVPACAR